MILSESLAVEVAFWSGVKVAGFAEVGVLGAEDEALDPDNDVIERIENLLLFGRPFSVVVDDGTDVVEAEEDGGTVVVGAGATVEDEVEAVTPATIDDEILYGRVSTVRNPLRKFLLNSSLFLGFIRLGSPLLLSR